MSGNKTKEISDHIHRTLSSYKEGNFQEALLNAKRSIEQISTRLLRVNSVATEEYVKKDNRHVEWSLEKKIKECNERDLLPSSTCAEMLLVKDWRNDVEHVIGELKAKAIASYAIEVVRKLYLLCKEKLTLHSIEHWPDFVEAENGNMLPFSPTGVTAQDGQLVIQGSDGQRVVLDFVNDGAVWVDGQGNKKFYKGNIGERNISKGWIG